MNGVLVLQPMPKTLAFSSAMSLHKNGQHFLMLYLCMKIAKCLRQPNFIWVKIKHVPMGIISCQNGCRIGLEFHRLYHCILQGMGAWYEWFWVEHMSLWHIWARSSCIHEWGLEPIAIVLWLYTLLRDEKSFRLFPLSFNLDQDLN